MTTSAQLNLFSDWDEAPVAANDNDSWEARFERFHAENPDAYDLFKKYTFEAIMAGREHFSVISIFERIRWYTDVETQGDPFKINQNFAAYYGRKFMQDFPAFEGFFRTRKLRGKYHA
jgi:hypothetical protein